MTTHVAHIVGYLATHPDGYECRLGPDLGHAQLYATRNHAMLEPMYVRRDGVDAQRQGPLDDAGFAICRYCSLAKGSSNDTANHPS